jgi:transposase-like protein
MTIDLTDPTFHDDDKARDWLASSRWPNGPVCPHCGCANVVPMGGTKHRAGLLYCQGCRGQFTVLTGSVMEGSHIPLPKWVLAIRLMAGSKKGVSAHQLHRTLHLTYKTAWFMGHRIREAMREPHPAPLGGQGKVIEADEAYHGKKEIPTPSRHRRGAPYIKKGKAAEKRAIVALVERGGEARAFHMPVVTAKNIREKLVTHASRESRLHTDESKLYPKVGEEFAIHETVHHAAGEYARGDVTTNTVEGFFGIFKRGMVGVYQHCGEQHFRRYIDEFTFRYSNRIKLGVDDDERAVIATHGMNGKRLTYRRIDAPKTPRQVARAFLAWRRRQPP